MGMQRENSSWKQQQRRGFLRQKVRTGVDKRRSQGGRCAEPKGVGTGAWGAAGQRQEAGRKGVQNRKESLGASLGWRWSASSEVLWSS